MGHQAHAAFLRTVEEADPALSEALHTPNLPVRPFSVSPLQGTPLPHNGQVHLSPEQTYWLRFTILYPPIFERFMQRFLHGEGRPIIQLGEAALLIREILTTPESHPWAGYTTWESLAQQAQDQRDVTMEFVTPTAFSFGQKEWGKKIIVLPQPEVVFDNLARAWNNLAPPQVQVDRSALKTYLEEYVVIKRIEDLTTQMLDFGRARQVGFVGCVTYGLMGENAIARAQLNMLADFAFYAGVGYKTTMGMGQCRKQEARGKGQEAGG
jgi:CRISPR-associated endoribonuclease Cas6